MLPSSPLRRRARRALAPWLGILIGVAAGAAGAAWLLSADDTEPQTPGNVAGPLTTGAATIASTTPPLPPTVATSEAPTTTSTAVTTTTTTLPEADAVAEAMASMSDEDKVGQLFVVELYGKSATDTGDAGTNRDQYGWATPGEVITRFGVGGVVYFAHNVDTPEQVAIFSQGLQDAARSGNGIGLLIAADQEGGRVVRIRDGATVFPAAQVFGAVNSTELTWQAAAATADELRAMGINQVFAPVADVVTDPGNQVIGDRSYGSGPDLVARQTSAAVRGFWDRGVAATVKHFPGHGNTSTDSHQALAVIDVDRERWLTTDRVPFAAAIGTDVPVVVMVGHISIPVLDPEGGPATLSPALIGGELRGELDFDGVVVTDSLRMGGVRNSAGDAEIAVRAIEAGVDMLLMPNDFTTARQAILDALGGRISHERLDQSVERILRLKEELGVLDPPQVVRLGDVAAIVGSDAHRLIKEQIEAAAPG